MSWIQNLCETYDRCTAAVGISGESQRGMLFPLGHSLKPSDVAVYLLSNGTFSRAEKNALDICVPCSDESEARTSGAKNYPHPLFDQIKHLTGKKYLDNLINWTNFLAAKPEYKLSFKTLCAVLQYIKNDTLKSDLNSCGIKPDDKLFVRFCVSLDREVEDRLWRMPELWKAWNAYFYQTDLETRDTKDVCYISGKTKTVFTEKHSKSINRAAGNAKLISGNDKDNFTFRGRFDKPSQAVTVGYEASQKAHQALRWLISQKNCFRCDTQAIIAWAIDSIPDIPDYYEDSYNIYETTVKSDSAKLVNADNEIYADYARSMKMALLGFSSTNKLLNHIRRVAVMATDSATTGRMSITYYRELMEQEYLERICNWHTSCRWYQQFDKEQNNHFKNIYYIGAPSIDRITEAVLGKKRSITDQSYDNLKKALREQLLHCIFDGQQIPRDMVVSAVHQASNPLSLENTKAKLATERWRDWEQILSAACAMVNRYYYDYHKEEFDVKLEIERTDRDYLYGRLLAVADRIESYARYKQGNSKDDSRATNAIRYMTVFSLNPFRTWNMLFTQLLNPYIQELNGADWYLDQIGIIMALFKDGEFNDASLDGRYLLGFFAQRQFLR
jgi:CRISPR-associated protein Csd1